MHTHSRLAIGMQQAHMQALQTALTGRGGAAGKAASCSISPSHTQHGQVPLVRQTSGHETCRSKACGGRKRVRPHAGLWGHFLDCC
jgi:hypothetical protein